MSDFAGKLDLCHQKIYLFIFVAWGCSLWLEPQREGHLYHCQVATNTNATMRHLTLHKSSHPTYYVSCSHIILCTASLARRQSLRLSPDERRKTGSQAELEASLLVCHGKFERVRIRWVEHLQHSLSSRCEKPCELKRACVGPSPITAAVLARCRAVDAATFVASAAIIPCPPSAPGLCRPRTTVLLGPAARVRRSTVCRAALAMVSRDVRSRGDSIWVRSSLGLDADRAARDQRREVRQRIKLYVPRDGVEAGGV